MEINICSQRHDKHTTMLEMMCKGHTTMPETACMREVGTFDHAGTRRHIPLKDYDHENGRFIKRSSSLVNNMPVRCTCFTRPMQPC